MPEQPVEPITDEWFNEHYEKPITNWNSFAQHAECKVCAVDISTNQSKLRKHVEWHEKFDELVDWAQHISKLFGGQSEAPSTEL